MSDRANDTSPMNWTMRLSLVALALALLFAAGWGITMILLDWDDDRHALVLAAPFIVAGGAVFTLMCGWFAARGRFVMLMNISAVLMLAIVGVTLLRLWVDVSPAIEDRVAPVVASAVLLITLLLIQAGFGGDPLTNEPFADDPSVQRFRLAARWVLSGSCVAIVVITWIPRDDYASLSTSNLEVMLSVLSLVFAAGVILAAMVTVRMRALRRRHMAQRETLPRDARLKMTCPKCDAPQQLRQGVVRCSACRAEMFIELEEPRCACGYVLYRLAGDSCPECGRDVVSVREAAQSAAR